MPGLFQMYHYHTIVTVCVPTCVCVPRDGGKCGGEQEARCSPGRQHPATGSRPPRPRLIASTGPRSEAAPGITPLQTLPAGSCIMHVNAWCLGRFRDVVLYMQILCNILIYMLNASKKFFIVYNIRVPY